MGRSAARSWSAAGWIALAAITAAAPGATAAGGAGHGPEEAALGVRMAQVGGSRSAGEPTEITPGRPEKAALNDREVIERANAALNSVQTMSASFSQSGSGGRPLTGTVYVQRPGKLRFEYNKPSTMEVVSDGSTVLVRDRKLNTSDPYPVSQTPLKFLLSSRIDLARDATVRSVGREGNGVQITIEDSSTLGGTSRITLSFDAEIANLRRWRVVDPQGYTTTVALSGVEKNRPIDQRIFMLQFMRPVTD
ncbi:outer membrane lipoprotein carrier protein LolA [Enterovirga sp.]|jgi:outer membrane lipoprotein-sorting protein|uniref:LolA family protein n=1 Tax=Enterovirga sp. TaxID=2026350 RepID=UPI002622E946|nr:outer membrane lipoprotein carrier protein LolA [Enterovirga sp.]MDB5590221.1 cell envelope biosis protein LolA [Enterovirga sp.]